MKKHLLFLGSLITSAVLILAIGNRTAAPVQPAIPEDPEALYKEIATLQKDVAKMTREAARLSKRLDRLSREDLIIVDTAENKLFLLNDSNVVLMAPCSTGSGLQLDDPEGNRQWVFETPRGQFRIISKLVSPVWRKPDWAFIEEGESPPTDPGARLEEGVLGDYALGFGNGYFIHGTLYKRFLGKNVTHGCIRLGDEDLATLYESVAIGTKLLIF